MKTGRVFPARSPSHIISGQIRVPGTFHGYQVRIRVFCFANTRLGSGMYSPTDTDYPVKKFGYYPNITRIMFLWGTFFYYVLVGLKLICIVYVRPDHFSDSHSFGRNYPEILWFGNEFGFFFLEMKTNKVRVLTVKIGKRSETIRNFFQISADMDQILEKTRIYTTFSYEVRWRQTLYQNCRARWNIQIYYWLFYYLRSFKGLNIHYNIPY